MKRVLAVIAAVIVAILLLWAVLHVMITQINPAQESPKGHFGQPCWACHIVNTGADLIEE